MSLTLTFDKPSYASGDLITATYSDASVVFSAAGSATIGGQTTPATVTAVATAVYELPRVAGLAVTFQPTANPRVFTARVP